MGQTYIFWILILFLSCHHLEIEAIECRVCDQVATPSDCGTWTKCGAGEICFTREYKEEDGSQAYHLGCEASTLCELYLDAQNVAPVGSDGLCYNCCNNNSCNMNLCLDSVGKITPTPKPRVCPEFYRTVSNQCYFFGFWETTWQDARAYCKKTAGSDLASVNSGTEFNNINNLLIRLAVPVSSYWLGGFYSPASAEWEWVDRTQVVYKNWQKNFPPKINHTLDYYITQPIPINARASPWKTSTRGKLHPFICELTL